MDCDVLLLAVAGFIVANLLIGLIAGTGVDTVEAYALGKRKWRTSALVMTYLATMLCGSDLYRGVRKFATIGVSGFASTIGIVLGFAIRYLLFSDKFIRFRGCMTIGDVAGRLYGKRAKAYVGLIASFSALVYYGIQLEVLKSTLNAFLGMDTVQATYISTAVVILYTVFGGMRSVVATDILQFVFIILGGLILAAVSLSTAGGVKVVLNNMTTEQLTFFKPGIFASMASIFVLESIFLADTVGASLLPRTLMADSAQKAKKLFLYVALGYLLFTIYRFFIGVSISQIAPGSTENIIDYIFNNLLSIGSQVIVLLGLIALSLSSADSFLHASSVSLARDFIEPMLNGKELKLAHLRLIMVFVGSLGVLLANTNSIYKDINLLHAITVPTIGFPFIIGIYGLKPSIRGFWVAAVLGFVVFTLAEYGFLGAALNDYSTLFSAVINALVYLVVNYMENRKLVWEYVSKETSYVFDSR